MEGKVCVITGANSGIGKAMARQLSERGATVVLVARNRTKAEHALKDLRRKVPSGRFDLVIADLSLMSQVRRAAAEIKEQHPVIDVLANNAGVYLPTRRITAEGHEEMFALNHLAPFLLTHELLDNVVAAAPSRILTTSSAGHLGGHIDFDNLEGQKKFRALRQYCNTKLANVLFTRELARRLREKNVVAHCFHPGVVATGFAQDQFGLFGFLVRLGSPFMRTAEKAARTGTHLATSADAASTSGEYWANSRRRRPSREAQSDEVALRLWDVTERMLGLKV